MTKENAQSIALLIAMTIGVSVVAYFGLVANVESQVYRSVFLPYKNTSDLTSIIALSKPNVCKVNGPSVEGVPLDLVRKFLGKNSEKSSPVRLSSLEGEIPTVSWHDNQRLYEAGYIWKPENETMLWISRVGLNFRMTEALLCIETIVPTQLGSYGTLLFLKKIKGEWKLILERNAWVS